MLSALIVVFREVLEIAIIFSVVMAATRGMTNRAKWISLGFGGGILGSVLIAIFAETISNFAEGMGQEIFNAGVLLTASLVIGWTVVWMSSHAKEMVKHITHVGHEIVAGHMPSYTIALVIGLAMLREGSEIVLFIYGMLAAGQSLNSILLGSLGGFISGGFVGALIYLGIINLPTRIVFKVTSWMLILLAAGMASLAAKYLVAAGVIDFMTGTLWDSSWLIADGTTAATVLEALMGYSAKPTGAQALFFAVIFITLATLISYKKPAAKIG